VTAAAAQLAAAVAAARAEAAAAAAEVQAAAAGLPGSAGSLMLKLLKVALGLGVLQVVKLAADAVIGQVMGAGCSLLNTAHLFLLPMVYQIIVAWTWFGHMAFTTLYFKPNSYCLGSNKLTRMHKPTAPHPSNGTICMQCVQHTGRGA
jgi:hypothetical protein